MYHIPHQLSGNCTKLFFNDYLQIAKSGACFVCDNSKGSSLIAQIARAAKQSNGHVTFINCPRASFAELRNLKQECGKHIDFL